MPDAQRPLRRDDRSTMDRAPASAAAPAAPPAVTILGPHPLLAIGIEPFAGEEDEIHLHAAGQGVWVARMAAALGAYPVLCGFLGGETGAVLSRSWRSSRASGGWCRPPSTPAPT